MDKCSWVDIFHWWVRLLEVYFGWVVLLGGTGMGRWSYILCGWWWMEGGWMGVDSGGWGWVEMDGGIFWVGGGAWTFFMGE